MAGELDRIGTKASDAIATADHRVVVSAVVIWEVAIKRRLGELEAPGDLLEQLEGAAVALLPITPRHADHVGELPLHHSDPFDRLLIAQATTDNLTLLSADAQFEAYDIELIW